MVGLWAHLTGRAPFLKVEGLVAAAGGHSWLLEKESYEKASKALEEAEAVVTEDSKAVIESDFPCGNIPFFDVTLAAYLLDPTRVTYPLSYLAGLLGNRSFTPTTWMT